MSDTPIVSVVITAFNRADTIERAIEGVQKQSFQDFEIVVVDDASTDSTSDIVARLTDPRIRLIRNATNRGIGGAKNVGIGASRGKYIAFLDSDDEWTETKLETQIRAMEEDPGCVPLSFSAFYVRRSGSGNQVIRNPAKLRTWRRSILLGETFSLGSTLLARRELFEEIGGFNEKLTRMQDRDWTLRYLDRYSEFLYLQTPLAIIHNTGFPKPETVQSSTRALLAANRDRLARLNDGSENLFEASLRFEVAVAFYRYGRYARSFYELTASILIRPAILGYLLVRLSRKLADKDYI